MKNDNINYNQPVTKLEDNPLQVKHRLDRGCECKVSCFKDLSPECVYRHRLNIAELTKPEHEMYLMGVTMASLADRSATSRHKERVRQRASYVYQGKKVCLYAFLYLENVTLYHLKRIRNHVLGQGVIPRVHGNTNRKPFNTFSLETYQKVENFFKAFLNLPKDLGSNKTVMINGITRTKIYNAYREYESPSGDEKLLGYTTFRKFLKEQFPNVKFDTKPEAKAMTNEKNLHIIRCDNLETVHEVDGLECDDDDIESSEEIEDYKIEPMESSSVMVNQDSSQVVVYENEIESVVALQAHIGKNGELIYTTTGDGMIYYDADGEP